MINKEKKHLPWTSNTRFVGITIAMGWQNIDLHDFLYACASSFNAFVKLLCKLSTPSLIARAQISSCGFCTPQKPHHSWWNTSLHVEFFCVLWRIEQGKGWYVCL